MSKNSYNPHKLYVAAGNAILYAKNRTTCFSKIVIVTEANREQTNGINKKAVLE